MSCSSPITLLDLLTLAGLASASDKIKKNEMGGACGAYGGGERLVQGWKPEGKRPLGRPRNRREDKIKMDLQEAGCGCMDWI